MGECQVEVIRAKFGHRQVDSKGGGRGKLLSYARGDDVLLWLDSI